MSDQVAIKTWGNSQGIRIPKNILEKLGLHVSDTLQIEVIDDSIVLKKAFKHKTFEERVAEYNGEITVDISHILGNLIKCTLCQGHYDFSFSDFYFIFVCCVEASK